MIFTTIHGLYCLVFQVNLLMLSRRPYYPIMSCQMANECYWTIKIILHSQIKGKIGVKAVSHFASIFWFLICSANHAMRIWKMFWPKDINNFCVCVCVRQHQLCNKLTCLSKLICKIPVKAIYKRVWKHTNICSGKTFWSKWFTK